MLRHPWNFFFFFTIAHTPNTHTHLYGHTHTYLHTHMYMRTHRKALLIRKTGDVRPVVSWLVRRNTSFSIAWPVGCSHKKKKEKRNKKN